SWRRRVGRTSSSPTTSSRAAVGTRSSACTCARSRWGSPRRPSTARSWKRPTAAPSSSCRAPAAAPSCHRTTTTEMLEPFREPFMQRAIAEMTLLALAGGALGCWVVLYELSYAAESLAHSLFPGLVLAAIAGVPLLLGATPAVVLAGLAIALVSRVPGVSRDVGVAVVVTTMFGLGVLLALSPESPPGIESLLFGDILGPSDGDLISAAILVGVLAAALPLFHARLLASGFDRAAARSLGLSPALADAALLLLLGAAVVVA